MIILIFILLISLSAEDIVIHTPEPKDIMKKHELYEYAKSSKGWLRVLNNEEKIKSYGFYFCNNDLPTLKEYFKSKLKDSSSRSIR